MQKFIGKNRLFIREGYDADKSATLEEVNAVWNDVVSMIRSTDRLTGEVAERTFPEKVISGILYINAGTLMKKRIMENYAALDISLTLKGLTGKDIGVCILQA